MYRFMRPLGCSVVILMLRSLSSNISFTLFLRPHCRTTERKTRVKSVALPDFRLLFESIPGPTLVLLPDDPTFTIVAVTDIYLKNTASTREQLLGRGLFEIVPGIRDDS